MGRIIDRDKIRKGDKISVKYTVEVASDLDVDGDFETPSGDWFEFQSIMDSEVEVELLERTNPELPRDQGATILVAPKTEVESPQYWMILNDGDLVSTLNVRRRREDFLKWIEETGRSFEVAS